MPEYDDLDEPIRNTYELYDAAGEWLGSTTATSCEEAIEKWLRLHGEYADRAVL